MGKPKFSRKKYMTPSHPWQESRIKEENELLKKYGLKNKREVWKAETKLRKYRGQARELLAKVATDDLQSKKESEQLLMHLSRMNILPNNSTLDDVLALETESILSRRLQTLTYLKGLASTPNQARQLISHGHIAIGKNRVTVPGYIVSKDEEGDISYMPDSSLNDLMHPARPRSDFKSPIKKPDSKPEEKKPIEKKEEDKKPVDKQDDKSKKEETKKEEDKEPVKKEEENKIDEDKKKQETEKKKEEKEPEKAKETEEKVKEKTNKKDEENKDKKVGE